MPLHYRKRPVEVRAYQWTGNAHLFAAWVRTVGGKLTDEMGTPTFQLLPGPTVEEPGLEVKTLEGIMVASISDWVVCGIQGEFYPVKPDIFEQTYEAVNA